MSWNICTEATMCSSETRIHIHMMREGVTGGGESEPWLRAGDWHVARRHRSVSWRTCRRTTLHVSGPGTLAVSGVGGLLTRAWMCVCHVRLGWNHSWAHAHTLTLTWCHRADGVPDKHNLYLFPSGFSQSPGRLVASLFLSECIPHWSSLTTAIN